MKFTPLPLAGAYLIDLEKKGDERGFFARVFCREEFAQAGLESQFVQVNNSASAAQGTLRGLHYQLPPFCETKLVRCIKGSLWDVIVDLRPSSPTFLQHFGAVLSEENRQMMYVPHGFAHGFLTLEPNAEVIYFVSQFYSKEWERGLRWNDPALRIEWPDQPTVLSERDASHTDFDRAYHLGDLR